MTDAQIVAADDNALNTSPQPATPHRRNGFLKFLLICGLLITLAILTANIVVLSRQLESRRQQDREHLFFVLCDEQTSANDRADAFQQLVRFGHLEWRSALLKKTNLRGANVSGASLEYITITEADLQKADFSKSQMKGASLALSNATDALFGDVDLTEANLFKTILNKADMRSAVLSGASLSQATVHDANMVLCDMTECDLLMTDLTASNLAGSDLTGANLESAILVDCNLALARFDGASIIDADFTNSNWWRARGLTGEQQLELLAKYSPGSGDKDRLNDFEKWTQSMYGDSDSKTGSEAESESN